MTIATNADELHRLEEQERHYRTLLQATQQMLQEEMQPRIAELVGRLHTASEYRNRLAKLADLYRQRTELSKMLEDAEKPNQYLTDSRAPSVGADEAERFSETVEELLRIWNFPNLQRVTFSEEEQDIVISGRKRSSHGKGVRALTHAAFILALLLHCRRENHPHPGFVVIDSPLVVYREPEAAEGGEIYDVKDAFYRGVAAGFSFEQVIIIENEDPPKDLEGATIIVFTGMDHGRFGFLPRLLPASVDSV